MKNNKIGYLFVAPWIIGALLFTIGPIFISFGLSFTNWDMTGMPDFIGLENYTSMFVVGSGFYQSLKVTLIYTFLSLIVSLLSSLGLALLLNRNLKGIHIFKFLYFIPSLIPGVVLAAIFSLIYDPNIGILNYILSCFGIGSVDWLGNPNTALLSIIVMSIFTYSTGQMFLIFSSNLKEVPVDQMEAADLDGASSWQKLKNITLPYISPMILFNSIMAMFTSFNASFSVIYPMTNGGPNGATNILSVDIYENAFRTYDMGYASAEGVILSIIIGLLTILFFKVSKNSVNY